MPKRKTGTGGKYLYAIVSANGVERNFGPIGIAGGNVYTISHDKVAAVTSDVSGDKVRPERRNISAHRDVLKMLAQHGSQLPMKFGIIAESSAAVQRMLSRNEEAILSEIERLGGKLEMGLKVIWDVPNIFEYFINTHPELRAARDRLFGIHREPTQEEKIEVGRLFERILTSDKDEYTDRVEEILSGRCHGVKRNPPRSEKEVMNLACLIDASGQDAFESGVFEASRIFDNNFAFDYNGPWPPHTFVELEIK